MLFGSVIGFPKESISEGVVDWMVVILGTVERIAGLLYFSGNSVDSVSKAEI